MEPDDRRPVIINALYAWGGFVSDMLLPASQASQMAGNNYTLKPIAGDVGLRPSVLLIMGESLNPSHMGVLGYGRDTTPQLAALLQKYGGGEGKIISAGVSTRVSIPTFLNVLREPGNQMALRASPVNLFRIAKNRGFQTAFLSVQDMGGISSVVGKESIDDWVDALDHPTGAVPDNALVERLSHSKIDWDKPFFMVLNTRSTHLPYRSDFPEQFAHFSRGKTDSIAAQHVNEYDDAMLWFDQKVSDAIKYVFSASKRPVIVVLVSDHGEMVDDDGGRFGHNVLFPSVYVTPYIWMSSDPNISGLGDFASCPVNHYQLGKIIAAKLGGQVINSLEGGDSPEYWVNGTSIDGGNGTFKYRESDVAKLLLCGRH